MLRGKFGDDFTYEIIEQAEIKYLSRVLITCKKHNTKTEDMVVNLLHKEYPCRECIIENMSENDNKVIERKRRDLKELILEFEERHGEKFMYHDLPYSFTNMKTKVWIKCKKHNYFFMQSPNNHLNTNICCPKCIEESYKFTNNDDT